PREKAGVLQYYKNATQRGKDALLKLYPALWIELNNDRVAIDALLDAAKKADYFISVNGSSKHQAFYTVTNCRKDIIYP
ncbi:hypothetical protein Q604_UNBc4C00192G0001, partial [human gut metagenome]